MRALVDPAPEDILPSLCKLNVVLYSYQCSCVGMAKFCCRSGLNTPRASKGTYEVAMQRNIVKKKKKHFDLFQRAYESSYGSMTS